MDVQSSAQALTTLTLSGAAATTVHYARVRHRGEAGGPSDWSATVSFTTKGLISATTRKISGALTFGRMSGAAFGGGRFVCVGYGTTGALASAGMTVTSSNDFSSYLINSIPNFQTFFQVAHVGGRFLASARRTDGTIGIASSPTGVAWTDVAPGINCRPCRLATDGVVIVGMSNAGKVIISTDGGLSFTEGSAITSAASATTKASFCYSAPLDLFFCVCGGTIYKSADGVTWIAAYSAATGRVIHDICISGPYIVASGEEVATGTGFLFRSQDSTTWTAMATGYGRVSAVAHLDGNLYAAGKVTAASSNGYGFIAKSADNGGTLTTLATTGVGAMDAIAPDGGGSLVSCGYNLSGVASAGGIIISP
jgi:hypothetical protein